MNNFVPANFSVPKTLETERLRLRMLTVNDVVKDYDAVMTSVDHLKGVFGPLFPDWPAKDMTLEEDLSNLGWHQSEFQFRRSFTYTVASLDESRILGCVYIFPTAKSGYDTEIYMWVRESEVKNGLDEYLFRTVRKWITDKWPFKKVAYPSREIDWKTWKSLK